MRSVTTRAGAPGSAAPAVITKTKTITITKTDITPPTREKQKEKKKAEFGDGELPMYNLVLLGDEEYDEKAVASSICEKCKVGPSEAQTAVRAAQETGEGLICVTSKVVTQVFVSCIQPSCPA